MGKGQRAKRHNREWAVVVEVIILPLRVR
jgi:hypothetical protein